MKKSSSNAIQFDPLLLCFHTSVLFLPEFLQNIAVYMICGQKGRRQNHSMLPIFLHFSHLLLAKWNDQIKSDFENYRSLKISRRKHKHTSIRLWWYTNFGFYYYFACKFDSCWDFIVWPTLLNVCILCTLNRPRYHMVLRCFV